MAASEKMTQEAAYEAVCRLAREHALILSAAGGVVTIVHPRTQREEGLFEHIQRMHGLGPRPGALEEQRPHEAAERCQRKTGQSGEACGLTPPCPDCGLALHDVPEGS